MTLTNKFNWTRWTDVLTAWHLPRIFKLAILVNEGCETMNRNGGKNKNWVSILSDSQSAIKDIR